TATHVLRCVTSLGTVLLYSLLIDSISTLYSILFFFFYCSGDHRDLHSFPTRRSSDLESRRTDQRMLDDGLDLPASDHQGAEEILDRKSTRLNSSHQIISYAVFCLKKKKKKKKK